LIRPDLPEEQDAFGERRNWQLPIIQLREPHSFIQGKLAGSSFLD